MKGSGDHFSLLSGASLAERSGRMSEGLLERMSEDLPENVRNFRKGSPHHVEMWNTSRFLAKKHA